MLKALSKNEKDGTVNLVFLGLSQENCDRLVDNQPIPVRLRELDPSLPDITIVLFGGEDNDEMISRLTGAFEDYEKKKDKGDNT